jgi:hypothetical protein|eukprot:COSAG01_NODE_876_length_12963_cov_5.315454_6_plen_31_part_00
MLTDVYLRHVCSWESIEGADAPGEHRQQLG